METGVTSADPPRGAGDLPALPGAFCPNCQAPLHGQYCSQCGQNQVLPDRHVLALVNEFFDDVFRFDSRPARTVFNLFFRPGFLSLEYFAGRRARYVNPVRLYLLTSLIYFFSLSVQSQFWSEADVVIEEPGQENTAPEDIKAAIDELDLEFLTPAENAHLKAELHNRVERTIEDFSEDPGGLYQHFVGMIPPVMFFLVPVFAIALKILYLGSGTYYTQHLVYAIHNHSFMFLALLLNDLLEGLELLTGVGFPGVVGSLITFWVPIYLYLSMRRFYGEAHWLTTIKYILLATFYWMLFLVGLITALASDFALGFLA